jgi:nucleoside-diphosphate-sugar epimerase
MIGAYDVKPSSGKLLIMGYKKPLMFVPKGGKNFVAVSDVTVAICNALTAGNNGERYLVSGVNLSFKAYYQLQRQVGMYRQTIIEIPNLLLITIGIFGDLIRRLGFKTEVCSININQLIISEYYSNNKAKEALDLPETNLQISIKEAIDWFLQNKML